MLPTYVQLQPPASPCHHGDLLRCSPRQLRRGRLRPPGGCVQQLAAACAAWPGRCSRVGMHGWQCLPARRIMPPWQSPVPPAAAAGASCAAFRAAAPGPRSRSAAAAARAPPYRQSPPAKLGVLRVEYLAMRQQYNNNNQHSSEDKSITSAAAPPAAPPAPSAWRARRGSAQAILASCRPRKINIPQQIAPRSAAPPHLQPGEQRLLGGHHEAVHDGFGDGCQQLAAHDVQVGTDVVADALQVCVRGRHVGVRLLQKDLRGVTRRGNALSCRER